MISRFRETGRTAISNSQFWKLWVWANRFSSSRITLEGRMNDIPSLTNYFYLGTKGCTHALPCSPRTTTWRLKISKSCMYPYSLAFTDTYLHFSCQVLSNTRVVLETHLRIFLRTPRIRCPVRGIVLPVIPFAAHPLGFLDRMTVRLVPDMICVFLAFHDLQA